MSILVIDVGTSGLRAAVVRPDATIAVEQHRELLPDTPAPGLVEFDATRMAEVALDVARAVLAEGGPVDAVGIANQRASTIVWDRATGEPVGPALGWQDLRTIGTCLVLQADGLGVAPNASATKVAHLLDEADPDRTRDLCVGTVDTWLDLAPLRGRAARHRCHQRRRHRAAARRRQRLGRPHARRAPHRPRVAAHRRRLERRARRRPPRSTARRRSRRSSATSSPR